LKHENYLYSSAASQDGLGNTDQVFYSSSSTHSPGGWEGGARGPSHLRIAVFACSPSRSPYMFRRAASATRWRLGTGRPLFLPPSPSARGSRTGAAAGARDCWGGRGGGALPAAPSSSRVQAALLVERRADAGEPCHRHPPFPCSAGTRGATQRTYVTSVPAELRKEDSPIAHAQKRLSQEPWDSEPWDSDSLSEPWDAHPLLGGWETLSAPREGPPGPGSPMSSGGESLRTG